MSIRIALYDANDALKSGKNDYEDFTRPTAGDGDDFAYIASQEIQYAVGDYFKITTDQPGRYVVAKLDETLSETLVYIKGTEWKFELPLAENWTEAISDIAFKSKRHYVSVRYAKDFEILAYRNLSYNPHDLKDENGAYPHASANVETRNDATFFACNVLDGIYANKSHGSYPYHSWGVNMEVNAELVIDFGRDVEVDAAEITIRADFPHDSYWTDVTIEFSDGSSETFALEKVDGPQAFSFAKHVASSLTFKKLHKADDASPFPALTQLSIFGKNVKY
ncbi:MAG: hypothetical protein LBN22_04185 [Clostridiales Family XIII bacterium]|jgi:hypothetical protein|nr:hypothetical protein [Clostridiales Family XIII bacterium]